MCAWMKSNFMLKVRTRVLKFLNLVKTDFRILTDSGSELWFSFVWIVHCQDGERILVVHLASTAPHSPTDYSRSSAQTHVSWFLFGRKCSFFIIWPRGIQTTPFVLEFHRAASRQRVRIQPRGCLPLFSYFIARKRRRSEGGISQGRDEVFKQGRKVF